MPPEALEPVLSHPPSPLAGSHVSPSHPCRCTQTLPQNRISAPSLLHPTLYLFIQLLTKGPLWTRHDLSGEGNPSSQDSCEEQEAVCGAEQ